MDEMHHEDTPRAARSEEARPERRPNYKLIVIGLALSVAALLLKGELARPVSLAFLYAMSLTFLLYGLYPVPSSAEGTFGKLRVFGPAALGVFLFVTVWRLLLPSGGPQFIVLQNTESDARLRSHELPGGEKITLIDVDSLTDGDGLRAILDDINDALKLAQHDGSAIHPELRETFKQTLTPLKLGSASEEALRLVDRYESGESIDASWVELISELASQSRDRDDFLRRVNRSPFAILKIEESGRVRIAVLTPQYELQIGGATFSVPVIANPRQPVTGHLNEAVVLQAL